MFSVHTKTKSRCFEIPEKLKSDKLCYRSGLAWTVGLTVELKLRFEISLTLCVNAI